MSCAQGRIVRFFIAKGRRICYNHSIPKKGGGSMAEVLYAHSSLITALFYAASAVCLVLYAVFFALALRPKRGTLEWIALYDRPGLQLSAARHPLRPLVLLPALGAAILSGALYCLGICLQMRSFEIFRSAQGLRLIQRRGSCGPWAAACCCRVCSALTA